MPGRKGGNVKRRYITAEEAISLLPEAELIHTFYNMANTLLGADWERQKVIDLLRSADNIEITGEHAKSINHGLAAYSNDAKWQSEILFIQTDAKKLLEFDPPEEEGDKH